MYSGPAKAGFVRSWQGNKSFVELQLEHLLPYPHIAQFVTKGARHCHAWILGHVGGFRGEARVSVMGSSPATAGLALMGH